MMITEAFVKSPLPDQYLVASKDCVHVRIRHGAADLVSSSLLERRARKLLISLRRTVTMHKHCCSAGGIAPWPSGTPA